MFRIVSADDGDILARFGCYAASCGHDIERLARPKHGINARFLHFAQDSNPLCAVLLDRKHHFRITKEMPVSQTGCDQKEMGADTVSVLLIAPCANGELLNSITSPNLLVKVRSPNRSRRMSALH